MRERTAKCFVLPFYFNSFFQIWYMIGYYSCYIWPIIKFKWIEKKEYCHLLLWQVEFYSITYFLSELYVSWKSWPTCTVRCSMLLRHMAPGNKSFDSRVSCRYMTLAKWFGLRLRSLISWTKNLGNNSKSFSCAI